MSSYLSVNENLHLRKRHHFKCIVLIRILSNKNGVFVLYKFCFILISVYVSQHILPVDFSTASVLTTEPVFALFSTVEYSC